MITVAFIQGWKRFLYEPLRWWKKCCDSVCGGGIGGHALPPFTGAAGPARVVAARPLPVRRRHCLNRGCECGICVGWGHPVLYAVEREIAFLTGRPTIWWLDVSKMLGLTLRRSQFPKNPPVVD